MFGGVIINQIKIIVIDSGLSSEFINKGYESYQVDNDRLIKSEFIDQNGHGTYVNQIIQNLTNKESIIINYRLLNNELRGSSRDLLTMLENIPEDTNIINMSLSTGMSKYIEDINKVCEELTSRNITIIASISNNEKSISYPARFPCVLGVKGLFFKNYDDIKIDLNDRGNIVADKTPIVVKDIGGGFTFFGGSSKSAAYVSGVLAQRMQNKNYNRNFVENANKLEDSDIYQIYNYEYFPIKKCINEDKLKTIKLILEETFHMKYEDYTKLKIESIFSDRNKTLTTLLNSLIKEMNINLNNKFIRIIDFKNAYSIYDALEL